MVLIIMGYLIVAIIGFVSFSMQLLATKTLLPALGGSAAVWVGSLMFFQMALFFSYAITYYFIKGSKFRLNSIIAISWLINSFCLVSNFSYFLENYPLFSLVINLTIQFGLIFMSLLMVSPYLQIKTQNRSLNYYVSSNLGALLGLLSYPFLIEPMVGLTLQKYCLVVVSGLVFLWVGFWLKHKIKVVEIKPLDQKNFWAIIKWSSLGTMLLGTMSSALIQDIVSFPLLWVAPLIIYLASFIWAFSYKPWGLNFLKTNHLTILELVTLGLIAGVKVSNWGNIVLSLVFFLVIMLIIQKYLAEQAPKDKEQLPAFYFYLGLGGLVGGVVVNLLVPLIFVKVNEYLFLVVITLALVLLKEKRKISKLLSFAVIVIIFGATQWYKNSYVIDADRSFYGLIRVIQQSSPPTIKELSQNKNNDSLISSDPVKSMMHGQIVHGQENLNKIGQPNTYYQPTMVGDLFLPSVKKIALVGLGAGVLLHYPTSDMQVTIFEIDPIVVKLARDHFSYLNQSKFSVEIKIGDGRKLLEQSSVKYDLIIIDAFSGDAIPVHLITKEALELYRNKLSDNGVLALHLSNNFLNLKAVVEPTALAAGFQGSVDSITENNITAVWGKFKKGPVIINNLPHWTDDYSSLLKIIK